jgi:hypothetical protein
VASAGRVLGAEGPPAPGGEKADVASSIPKIAIAATVALDNDFIMMKECRGKLSCGVKI